MNRELRIAGAEFLEVAADIYALIPFADRQIGSKNQVCSDCRSDLFVVLRLIIGSSLCTSFKGMCMVLACSARLDAATFEDIRQLHVPRYDRDSKVSIQYCTSHFLFQI